jgi:hypothetical protein
VSGYGEKIFSLVEEFCRKFLGGACTEFVVVCKFLVIQLLVVSINDIEKNVGKFRKPLHSKC